jgi:molybdate transport system ATP-binding protein
MSLRADVQLTLGTLDFDAAMDVADGEMLAVIGPNGAGKTTLLRALAGLLALRSGRIAMDDMVLDEPADGRFLPPEKRPIGVVFQDYLLFPHLSALDNVAFGLRSRGASKSDARKRARAWLERVGLDGQAGSRPRALSGGQAQRVALARALVTEPRLLLLDEPLAAVDVSTRAEVRRTLKHALADFPGVRILVTHDPLEAATLASRIIVLEGGKLAQAGSVAEVTARPRSRWVADMLGLNLYQGRSRGTRIEIGPRAELTTATPADGDVFAIVTPNAVTLHRDHPDSSARNVWPGTVDGVDLEGDRVRVHISGILPIVAEVTPAAVAELQLVDGGAVWFTVKATEIAVYPA